MRVLIVFVKHSSMHQFICACSSVHFWLVCWKPECQCATVVRFRNVVIRFLHLEKNTPIKIYCKSKDLHDPNVMNRSTLCAKVVQILLKKREKLRDTPSSGWPLKIDDTVMARIEENLCSHHCQTLKYQQNAFPDVSLTNYT